VRTIADIEADLEAPQAGEKAARLLGLGEEALSLWLTAQGHVPTHERSEGFRLLALHRQGARGDPSFNACRETCRELVYHFNLLHEADEGPQTAQRTQMMRALARHLALFIGGKLENAGFGEFCCSSRHLRLE
jgi:hypothetical protein